MEYKKLGNEELSNEWFIEASKYLTTYYGQLAFMELNPNKTFELSKDIEVSKEYREYFFKKELVKYRHFKRVSHTKINQIIIKDVLLFLDEYLRADFFNLQKI